MAEAILGHGRVVGKPTSSSLNSTSALLASANLAEAVLVDGVVCHDYVDPDVQVAILAVVDETDSTTLEDLIAALPGHPKPVSAALTMVRTRVLRREAGILDAHTRFSRALRPDHADDDAGETPDGAMQPSGVGNPGGPGGTSTAAPEAEPLREIRVDGPYLPAIFCVTGANRGALKREHLLNSPGIYIALWNGKIYVGASMNTATRVTTGKHLVSPRPADRIIAIVDRTGQLDWDAAQVAERLAYRQLTASGELVGVNGEPSGGQVDEAQYSRVHDFVETVMATLRREGLVSPAKGAGKDAGRARRPEQVLFRTKSDVPFGQAGLYRLDAYGLAAKALVDDNSWTLLAGSTVRRSVMPSAHPSARRRRVELLHSGGLIPNGKDYLLTEDLQFGSATGAAHFILGSKTRADIWNAVDPSNGQPGRAHLTHSPFVRTASDRPPLSQKLVFTRRLCAPEGIPMSVSDLDLPDYRDELEAEPASFPAASKALLTTLLDQMDTAAIAAALQSDVPHLVVLKAPSASWAKALAKLVTDTYPRAHGKAVTELRKDGNDSVTEELQRRLTNRRHMVLVSQDPDTLLPRSVTGAVDIRLDLPHPNRRSVAAAIGQVSGTLPPALKVADIAELDFEDLELALREGSNATDCVRRLRRAAAVVADTKVAAGLSLAELPLGREIRMWSDDLLDQINQVTAGKMAGGDLSYPVLEGPPGTGKTMLASALARSADWSFVSTSVGAWFNSSDGHLGGVVRSATSFIDQVLAKNFTVGLIDELDALPDRDKLESKDRDWWTPVITQVLLQIDRVRKANRPVILMGATNYFDRLDSALVRPGRLEQRVSVLPPRDPEEVLDIFAHYLRDDIDQGTLAMVARLGAGATPAQIAGWCRTARAKARHANCPILAADLLETVAPDSGRSEGETWAVAIHEAGHVALARHFGVKVHGVSILEKGRSGGHTLAETLSNYPNRFEIETMALILLGGRAADMVLGKGGHTGAEGDLDRAGRLISDGIATYGLYGDLATNRNKDFGLYARTNRILQGLLRVAVGIVDRDRLAIVGLAERLVAEWAMTPEAIDAAWKEASRPVLIMPKGRRSVSHV